MCQKDTALVRAGGIFSPKFMKKEVINMEKMAMSVKELALTLGISLPVAYELPGTPSVPWAL